jgi:tRNA A-37 threonylcarbamoyl transferase component Bud32
MGCVYLARDQELERAVAVKTVKDLDLDEERKQRFLDRFKNEARAAARLHHPAIVQVFDVGDDPDVGPFLVLEYVRGSSLKQILRERGPLPPHELTAVAKELAAGIDLAHAAGIIHRDIKPDNVLVAEDQTGGARAKLADFGVARVPNAALTKEGQFLGTPCYAAPETLSSGSYGPQTDLFSFAAMLYELATGTRAFPGDEAIAVAHSVIHDDPPAPSTVAKGTPIPAAVDRVLLAALSKDAAGRPSSASALAEDLALAYGEAETHAGTTLGARRDRPRPGGGVGLPVVLLLLVMTALGVGLVMVFGNPLGLGAAVPDGGVLALPDAGSAPMRPDAGPLLDAPIATDVPLDVPRPDSGTPDAGRTLSRSEREDMAKDEIDRARELLESGDRAGAREHLDRARELDPESSDLEELEALLSAP